MRDYNMVARWGERERQYTKNCVYVQMTIFILFRLLDNGESLPYSFSWIQDNKNNNIRELKTEKKNRANKKSHRTQTQQWCFKSDQILGEPLQSHVQSLLSCHVVAIDTVFGIQLWFYFPHNKSTHTHTQELIIIWQTIAFLWPFNKKKMEENISAWCLSLLLSIRLARYYIRLWMKYETSIQKIHLNIKLMTRRDNERTFQLSK